MLIVRRAPDVVAAVTAAALVSACFTGAFAAGRPCAADDDCGPSLSCRDGYCDGALPSSDAETSSISSSSSSTGGASEGDTSGSTSTGEPASSSTAATTGSPYLCDKIDILIVLDQSPSMGQWDGRLVLLANDIINFAAPLLEQIGSFHLGITMTDATTVNPAPCQLHGALAIQYEDGPLCASLVDRPYLDEKTSFDLLTFSCFVPYGVGSDEEQPMRAMLAAVSPELNADGACNNGFHREDALLVIIFITDEDDDPAALDEQGLDGSPGDPQYWYQKLRYFKQGNDEALVVGALLGEDPESSSCAWMLPDSKSENTQSSVLSIGAEEGVRIRQFMDLLPVGHAYVSSICNQSYTDFFDQFFGEIVADACEDHDPAAIDPLVEDPTDP